VDSLGIDGAAKGYPQLASQVVDGKEAAPLDLASAKGNGFADL